MGSPCADTCLFYLSLWILCFQQNHGLSLQEKEEFKKMEEQLLKMKLEKARMEGTLDAQEKVLHHEHS